MDRRTFLTLSTASPVGEFLRQMGTVSQIPVMGLAAARTVRRPVLVRAGFTRESDAKQIATAGQQTVVRSSDSEGRLAVFILPVGTHAPYRGAPLHVHHEQDEWIHVLAGEFVAEVGAERLRLKVGDSLLMPLRIPHRWSVAQEGHSGAIHLYTPAGFMDAEWASVAQDENPVNQEARKAEFEKHGLTLLGTPLTKEEIDGTT